MRARTLGVDHRQWCVPAIAAVCGLIGACGGNDRNKEAEGPPATPSANFDQNLVAHRTILPQAIVSGKAMSGFVGYVLTVPKADDNPECRLSASALRDAAFTITRFVPTEGVSTVPLGDILYQSVVDKATAGNVGYLAATVSVSDSEVAEVIIEDAFEQEVDPGKIDVAALTNLQQQRDTSQVCGYYFVSRAFLTTVKSRTYSRVGGEGQFAFAVTVGGRRYVSTSNFRSQTQLAIDARPLSTLVHPVVASTATGLDTVQKPVTVEAARMVLTAKDIPDTSSARLPTVVRLPSGWYDKQQMRVLRAKK